MLGGISRPHHDVFRDQDAAMSRARGWLNFCVKEHKNSCDPGKSGKLPRRLLNVGTKASPKIVLVETGGLGLQHPEYACLSYRWGVKKEDILRTTSDNIGQHLNSIVLEDLPQTIIDTVEVCRELNIHYLWVDSLCIIQPRDEESFESDKAARRDWLEEGSTMHNAYGNSHLTIYAESASSCNAGFLRDCKFGCTSYSSDYDYVFSDDSENEYTEPAENDGGGSVLSLRGWCLQEYLVPNRRLRFYEAEMVWECNCCSISEGDHTPDTASITSRQEPQQVDPPRVKGRLSDIKPISSLSEQRPESSSFDHVKEWWKIVEDYSWRSISNPEINKLMGVSGVASLIHKASIRSSTGQDTYMAGLWHSKLLDGLAWMSLRTKNGHKPLYGSAPTWSWASIDGPVTFNIRTSSSTSSNHNMVKNYDTKFVSFQLTEDSPSTPRGYITLGGPLIPVQLAGLDEESSEEWRTTHNMGTGSDFRPLTLIRPKSMESYAVVLDFDGVDGIAMLKNKSKDMACWKQGKCDCGTSDESCFSDAAGFFSLRLHTWKDVPNRRHQSMRRPKRSQRRTSKLRRCPDEIWFLVLKKMRSGYYERVGIGWSSGNSPLFRDQHEKSQVEIV